MKLGCVVKTVQLEVIASKIKEFGYQISEDAIDAFDKHRANIIKITSSSYIRRNVGIVELIAWYGDELLNDYAYNLP